METENLIDKITGIYFRFGIKSITMDDLAKELGLSKKTIYQHFKDKEDVVYQVIDYHINRQHSGIREMLDDKSLNAIDHLLLMSKYISGHLNQMNPAFSYDLQRYYPKAWEKLIKFKREHVFTKIMENIQKGIQQGIYLKDLNYEIIANIYVDMMEMFSSGEYSKLEQYSKEELFQTLFVYHIRGIANQEGIKYLNNKLKENIN